MKCYKDSLKENLKKCGLQPKALCEKPLDHDSLHSQCKEVAATFKASRVAALEVKRAAHKQAALPSMDAAAITGFALPNWTLCPQTHASMMLQSIVFDGVVHTSEVMKVEPCHALLNSFEFANVAFDWVVPQMKLIQVMVSLTSCNIAHI